MSVPPSNKPINQSLYILKVLCAFGVVILHIDSFFDFHVYGLPFIRIAVPCFLLISGYFLVEDQCISTTKVDKQMKKVVGLIVLFNILFLCFSLINNVVSGKSLISPKWLTLGFWGRWLILGDNICYAYWYLTAYLIGLVLVRFTGNKSHILYLVPVLMIAAVALSHYAFLLFGKNLDPGWCRNGFLCAYPCLLTGAYIRKNEERITSVPFLRTAGTAMVFVVVAYIECLIFRHLGTGNDFDYFLLTFPLAISIFILALSFERILRKGNLPEPVNKISTFIAGIGQRHSTNIYMVHPIIIGIIEMAGSLGVIVRPIRNAECVFLLSILVSEIIIRLKRHVA